VGEVPDRQMRVLAAGDVNGLADHLIGREQ